MIKVLVVDDSALMRRLLGNALKAEMDIQVEFARDGLEALELVRAFQPDVITLDVQMPRMDGISCLDRIMLERPSRVIMVSSLTEAGADITLEAMSLGAVDFVPKPAGAVSLAMDEFAPLLVERVRSASKARLRPTLRLAERVRLRANGVTAAPSRQNSPPPSTSSPAVARWVGPADAIVTVGTSTGGPPALDILLSALPAHFRWPVVVAQHMPASFTGPLSRRLDQLCAVRVTEVTAPTILLPGHVYIAKGDADIIVSTRAGNPIVLNVPSSPEYRWHPSVDRLVASAIEAVGAKRLVGILMTGMGNDGAASMARLRAEGGHTIAEAEETAVIWGMPGELVKANGADVVAPVHAISTQLMEWAA